MLQNLHVKNLALIDEAEVDFSYGLNILTGETGAGKSIIIGSINLALGEKVPKEMLKENGEPSLVELVFHVDNDKTIEALRELDVEVEDNTIILSRKISAGRAVGKVNGEAVSVSQMRAIASLLIDIHGQHDHQSLGNKKKQLEILDAYAKDKVDRYKEPLAQAYANYRQLEESFRTSNVGEDERKRELALLEYEVKEIEEAQLVIGEDEELEADFRKYANGKKIMEGVTAAYSITGGEMESSSEQIGRAVRELSMVAEYDEAVENLSNQLAEIDNLLSDFNHEISGYINNVEFDGEAFYEIEKRLDLLNHLKSKYGNTIEEILEEYTKKSERVAQLNDYDTYLDKLKIDKEKAQKELEQLCGALSEARKEAAKEMSKSIAEALQDLNFLDVIFEMRFERTSDYTANGFDDAEFYISTNPGEPAKPLAKVASGGEQSRIMLAIKTVMAESDELEALIFDEIDTGISGRTAQMVSEKMNVLSRNHQIICITHLPQIAAMADTHFLIEKEVSNQATYSHIRCLNDETSVQELARMLGGVEITEAVVNNAREMKQMAYSKK